jgi:hypothetical protein
MRTSIVAKVLMAFIFASVIGGISAGPALGQNDYRRPGPPPRGYYDHRGGYDNRGRVYRPRGYYYPAPRYGPPIYTVPAPSPGISLFFPFPFDIR